MSTDHDSSHAPAEGYVRDQRYLATRITADGRDGYPAVPDRYRLVVSRACPWAHRAVIVRRLLGLEPVLSMGVCGPTHDERSWTFDLDPGGRDPVLGIERLQEAFFARDPQYPLGITVPAIVDIPTGQVVTNDFAQMTLDLSTEWRDHHRPGAPDLYPERRREEIDQIAADIFSDVNNAVYQCGFAGGQEAYERAYHRLFASARRAVGPPQHPSLPGRRHASPRPTSGSSRHWSASTPSTTATSSVIARSSPRCRCSGRTPGTFTRRRASETPSTSVRSRSTTTSCTAT